MKGPNHGKQETENGVHLKGTEERIPLRRSHRKKDDERKGNRKRKGEEEGFELIDYQFQTLAIGRQAVDLEKYRS